MHVHERVLVSAARGWWLRQALKPMRQAVWIWSAITFTFVFLGIPLAPPGIQPLLSGAVVLNILALGLAWFASVRRARGITTPPGRLFRIVRTIGIGVIAMIAVPMFMSGAITSSNPMIAALGLVMTPLLLMVIVLSMIGVVIGQLMRSSGQRPKQAAPTARTASRPNGDQIPTEDSNLLAILHDPAQLNYHLYHAGLGQKLERLNQPTPSSRRSADKSPSAFDLAFSAHGLTRTLKRRFGRDSAYFYDSEYRYQVPQLARTEITKAGVLAWFRLLGGTSAVTYEKPAEILANSLGVRGGIAVSQSNQDRAEGLVQLAFNLHNALKDIVPFTVDPGTPIPSSTPWHIGRDATGKDLVYDIAKNAHLLIAGATRSGKSVSTYSLITHLLRMGDSVRLLVCDPNDTTIAPFEEKVSWSTNESHPGKPTEMLKWVRSDVMEARRPTLRSMRRDKFDDFTRENPMYVVIIDEAANYMRHSDGKAAAEFNNELMAVVAQGAKFGVRIVLITQRPDSTILPTSVRAQLSARISFRLEDLQTANMVFPDLDNPSELLDFEAGVGMFRETGGRPRKFRSVFLEDHWGAADQIKHPLPKIEIDDFADDGFDDAAETASSSVGRPRLRDEYRDLR